MLQIGFNPGGVWERGVQGAGSVWKVCGLLYPKLESRSQCTQQPIS